MLFFLNEDTPLRANGPERRAYKRALRRLSKRAALRPLLPFASRSLARLQRITAGASNQVHRFPSCAEAALWSSRLLDEVGAFVEGGAAPRLPSAEEQQPFVGGRPPGASAAVRAVLAMCEAANAKQRFETNTVQAALELIRAGECEGEVSQALRQACEAHARRASGSSP